MPKLLITSKVKNGHTHIVYMRDDGSGETSTAKKHSHQLYQGEVVPADDGHTHQLTEYAPKPKKEKEQTDEDKIREVMDLYTQAKEIEKDAIKKAEDAEKIYCNEQWPSGSKPTGDNRSSITVNVIKKNIDGLSGYQRQHRTDLRYLPTEDGDQKVADLLNVVVKGILENCTYSREETRVAEDVMIVGRGFFHIYVDREKNLQGDIVIERFPWGGGKKATSGVYLGPFEKDDLSDLEYLVKWKRYSEGKVKSLYPDQMDKIFPSEEGDGEAEDPHNADKNVAYQQNEKKADTDPELIDAVKKQYTEIELFRREYKRAQVIVNVEDEFYFNAEGWEKADINAAVSIPGMSLIPRSITQIRRTKVMSKALLDDDYPDDGIDGFSLIPVFATRRRGEWWGKVEDVKELQYAINKVWSQFIDVFNKVVAYGYYIDSETFPSPEEEENFKRNSSSPGFVAKVSDVNKPPKKEEGIKFPNELAEFLNMLNIAVKENMSINLELLGMSEGNQSGIAIRQKIAQQLLGNDYIFDNLSFAKRQLGRNLIKMIQKLYTKERMYRIVMRQAARPNPPMMGGRPLNEVPPEEVMTLLQTADLSQYDVLVSESSESPSAQISNFMLFLEMASKGIQIPPQILLKFAPVPDKEEIQLMLSQAMQAQAEAENKKYDTELKKAVIAQQGKMMAKGGGMMPPKPGGIPIPIT